MWLLTVVSFKKWPPIAGVAFADLMRFRITSAVGAVAIAWAASAETNLLLISGLTVVGAAIQLGTGGKSRSAE